MRKFILPILALSMSLTQAKAQNFYAKAGVGYAFSTAGQTMMPSGDPMNGSISSSGNYATFNYKSSSFGAGMYGTLGLGMRLSSHVGVELNGQFGLAMKKMTGSVASAVTGGTVTYEDTYYAKMPILLNPAIVLQTGKTVNLYTRMGLLLPLGAKIIDEFETYDLINTQSGTYEIKTKFSLGFSAATGVSYRVGNNVNIWAEANLNALSLFTKEAELTEYALNGENLIDRVVDDYKIIKYDNEGSGEDINPTFSVPFSSIGIMAGVSFEF